MRHACLRYNILNVNLRIRPSSGCRGCQHAKQILEEILGGGVVGELLRQELISLDKLGSTIGTAHVTRSNQSGTNLSEKFQGTFLLSGGILSCARFALRGVAGAITARRSVHLPHKPHTLVNVHCRRTIFAILILVTVTTTGGHNVLLSSGDGPTQSCRRSGKPLTGEGQMQHSSGDNRVQRSDIHIFQRRDDKVNTRQQLCGEIDVKRLGLVQHGVIAVVSFGLGEDGREERLGLVRDQLAAVERSDMVLLPAE
mmetsp:Transcript_62106/g.109361  ORF Transcript_62106/g.109361 Transcript_62106/m.109361 type:complete len:255 (-) Transcript_62106:950-1714(-)